MNTNNVPTWLPRVLGVVAGFIATKAAEKGLTVDQATLVAIGTGAYALVHRFVSSHMNPSDAAKRELVAPAKSEVAAAKATEAASK